MPPDCTAGADCRRGVGEPESRGRPGGGWRPFDPPGALLQIGQDLLHLAERRSSAISRASMCGWGRWAESSRLSSRSDKRSKLTLSRFTEAETGGQNSSCHVGEAAEQTMRQRLRSPRAARSLMSPAGEDISSRGAAPLRAPRLEFARARSQVLDVGRPRHGHRWESPRIPVSAAPDWRRRRTPRVSRQRPLR